MRIDYSGSSSSMPVHVEPNCAEPGITEWRFVATFGENERVRAAPFDAVELDLALLWAR